MRKMQREGGGRRPLCEEVGLPDCKAFTPAQIQQLSTPTYKSRKEREQKKAVTDSPSSAIPTLVDPSEVTLLGRVEGERVASVESTPAGKKKKRPDDPGPAKGNPVANPRLMTSRA